MLSTEIKTFVRQLEKWFEENPQEAIDRAISAMKEADEKGDYEATFHYAKKLAELYEKLGDRTKSQRMIAIATIRSSFLDNPLEQKRLAALLDLTRGVSKFAASVLEGRGDDAEKHYFLLELEQQSLWGDFRKIEPLPLIDFANTEEAKIILEDYFPHGVYHLHMVERNSHQRRRIDIPVGKQENLDIIDSVYSVTIKGDF
ncbi:MAG: hypothetical protein D6732_02575 [Methanobacteriota archaeon]|nr:MAG: hypothetical protein D6732_02575 [Euryarchaeota archaeon]